MQNTGCTKKRLLRSLDGFSLTGVFMLHLIRGYNENVLIIFGNVVENFIECIELVDVVKDLRHAQGIQIHKKSIIRSIVLEPSMNALHRYSFILKTFHNQY